MRLVGKEVEKRDMLNEFTAFVMGLSSTLHKRNYDFFVLEAVYERTIKKEGMFAFPGEIKISRGKIIIKITKC
jgi:hypothetical protein